jgi:hypothetical protein
MNQKGDHGDSFRKTGHQGRSGALCYLFGALVCQWQSDQRVAEEHTVLVPPHHLTGTLSLGTVAVLDPLATFGTNSETRHNRACVTCDESRRCLKAFIFINSRRIPEARGIHESQMPSAETETPTPELMLVFYRRLYPFKSIFKWLNHEHTPSRLFTHREIAFTLQNDVYLRYNSFTTADEFKKQTCTLNPTRFEIGPVYTARVRLSIDFLFPPRLSTPRC